MCHDMDKTEQELTKHQRQIWIQRIKESKFVIGLVLMIVIILSWNIYRSTDSIVKSEKMFGVISGIHQVQSNVGSSPTMLAVKLSNGESVIVTAPANLVIRMDAEVEIIRGRSAQGSVYYYFSSYREMK